MSSYLKVAIPNEWQIKKLKDCVKINPENLNLNEIKENYINYIDIASIDNSTFQIQETKQIPITNIPSRARRIVKENDVIISTVRPYLKAFSKIRNKHNNFICSTGFAVLRVKPDLDHEYLFQWVLNRKFVNYMISQMVGSSYPAVNISDVEVAPIILPPLNEQQKIASVLSNIDELIVFTRIIIDYLQILKKGVMQRLLTEGIGHSEFKDSKLGKIPKEWNIVKIEDICSLRRENYEPEKDSNFNYIGLEHINSGDSILHRFGTEKDIKSTQHRFYSNDILYGKLRPYLDKAVLVDFEGICSTDIIVLRNNEKTIPEYLVNILHTSRFLHYIISTMSGTTLPRTNWKDLSKFKVKLPPIEEQEYIMSIILNIDTRINDERKYIDILKVIKKGLMQDLLTGKKRVKVN